MKKQLVRLTESDLHNIIKESVNKVLKEHMEFPSENGGFFDSSERINSKNNTWRGVEGTKFIYHGEWSDPEVLYNDEKLNYNDLENNLWAEYEYECEEMDKKPSEEEYDNLPTKWFKEKLDNYMFDMFSDQY